MDFSAPGGPWFRRRPELAAAVTLALFVAVTVLRTVAGDERDAPGLLYALPVALAAMAFGRTVGTAAAVSAIGLHWAWAAGPAEASLSVLGWASRLMPLLLLGVLVGAAADAAEGAWRSRMALAVAEIRRRDAAEVNDEILQRLTVAKWRIEAGDATGATDLLEEAMGEAQRLVSTLLDGDAHDRMVVRSAQDRLLSPPAPTGRRRRGAPRP